MAVLLLPDLRRFGSFLAPERGYHLELLILGAQTCPGSFMQGDRLHAVCPTVFSQSLVVWLFSTFAGCLYKSAGCLVVGLLSPLFTWNTRPGGFVCVDFQSARCASTLYLKVQDVCDMVHMHLLLSGRCLKPIRVSGLS